MPNLSDLNPADVQTVSMAPPSDDAPAETGNLSDLSPQDVSLSPGGINEVKYGGLGQQTLGAAETAASAGTFGLSRGAERLASHIPGLENLSPEAQKGREEAQNPLVTMGAGGAGLLLGMLGPEELSAAGLLGKAGVSAASKAGLGVVGSAAIKGAVEGALFQGGNEVGKMLLRDPDQMVTTSAVKDGLLNMLIAGTGGAVIGGGMGLWASKFGPKTEASLAHAQDAINGTSPEITPQAQPELPPDALDLSESKSNIDDLQGSANRLGIDLTPGTISKSPMVQNVEGALARRPSVAGVAMAKEQQAAFDALEKSSKDILRDATNKTEAQVGKEIQDGIYNHFKDRVAESSAEYNELKPQLKEVPISDDLKLEAMDKLVNNEYVQADAKGTLGKLASNLGDRIENVNNVHELKIQRSLMGDELDSAVRSGDTPKINVLKTARDLLTDVRTKALEGANPEAGVKIAAADAKYAALQKDLQSFTQEAGIGGSNNANKLLARFGKIPYENFPGKVFNPNDISSMQYFKQAFPKEFELARRLKLADIAENSISEAQGKNSQFQVGSFLRQLSDKKLGPEARSMLLDGKNLEKLNDIQNVYRSIPGNPNPSNTSYGMALKEFLSPQGVMGNLTDALQYGWLKAQPHLLSAGEAVGGDDAAHLAALKFAATPGAEPNATALKQTADYIRSTIKGENATSNAIKSLFKSTGTVIPSSLIPSDKQREKLDKKLRDLQVDNSSILHTGEQIASLLPDHANSMSQTAFKAVTYLNSLRPKTDKANPLDSDIEVSEPEKANFNRALDIAEQPLLPLEAIKEGTLTTNDVVTLQNVYPSLYQKLSTKILHEVMNTTHDEERIPYKTRLGLSLFLGQPLDSSMSPQGIMAAQAASTMPNQQPQGTQGKHQGPHSMKNIGQMASMDQTVLQARQAEKMKG